MDKEIITTPDPFMVEYENGKFYHLQDESYDYMFECKICGNMIIMDNYCSKCGQKLRETVD